MIWFKNIVLAATMLALCVVVFGAYVRLTDAGLGCPDWPGCYGTLTVPESVAAIEKAQANYPESSIDNKKAWIEMIHRYIAAILGFISSKLINFIGLYNYNKILGLLFGSIKGLVFLSFFTYIIYQTDSQNYYMLKESEFMPIFKDFLDKYTQRGNSLFDSLELKI